MDRNLQGEAFTDSFVEIWIGKHETQRTHTIRKTLNPVWDEEFRFEIVDDSLLQNTPVEFKVRRSCPHLSPTLLPSHVGQGDGSESVVV
jgi:hypothetical protein